MVTVHVSLPDPPGERGRKVEYWRAKRRHKLVAPLILFTAVPMGASGWFAWRPDSRETAVLLIAMATAMAFLAVVVWRRGTRDRQAQRHLIRADASKRRKFL